MGERLIYLADEEFNISITLKSFLIRVGFEVEIFNDGYSTYRTFIAKPSNILILSISLPGIDGYSLYTLIRSKCNIPIILIYGDREEYDVIAKNEIVSADYLIKPFSPMELIARVESVFRRNEICKCNKEKKYIFKISDIIINTYTKQAEFNGKNIGLTGMEFSLLYYLAENKNVGVSRSELLINIWGYKNKIETRAPDDMLKRIRRKLSNVGSRLRIETIRGFGFIIQQNECFINNDFKY